jgi:hypothetical protein
VIRSCCLTTVLVVLAGRLFGQTVNEKFDSHITWKQVISEVTASVLDEAATDSAGDLWFISNPWAAVPRDPRLIHIDSNGAVISRDRLPESVSPAFPEVSSFALAASSSGPLAVVAHHSHAVGRGEYFDGADFVLFDAGKWGAPVKIARSGPEYKTLTALSDGHFLAMGDQVPWSFSDSIPPGKLSGAGVSQRIGLFHREPARSTEARAY